MKRLFCLLAAICLVMPSTLLFADVTDASLSDDSYLLAQGDGEEGGSSESTSSDDGGDDGVSSGEFAAGDFKLGFGVESVTVEDTLWTRIHLFPVIPVWKFKFALDFEVFINDDLEFSSKGWDFSTFDSGVDSVLRKIYFISFSDKQAVIKGDEYFYARVGALEGVNLGDERIKGLIVDNYMNTLDYPSEKNLGLQLAFRIPVGEIMDIGAEGFLNNFADILKTNNMGAVVGGRVFIAPLKKIGLLKKLQVGVSFVADLNQYAGLKDYDGDAYPDLVDRFPYDNAAAFDTDGDGQPDGDDLDRDGDGVADYEYLTDDQKTNLNDILTNVPFYITNAVDFDVEQESLFSLSGATADFYGMFGVDVIFPVFNNLVFYAQWAMTFDDEDESLHATNFKADGWGLAGPGLVYQLDVNDFKVFRLNVEFRRQAGSFEAGYFDSLYDHQRAFSDIAGTSVVTKDNLLGTNVMNGVYGNLTLNLFVIYAEGSYEWLFPEGEIGGGSQAYTAKATLNTDWIGKYIPIVTNYVSEASFYIQHKDVTDAREFAAVFLPTKAALDFISTNTPGFDTEFAIKMNPNFRMGVNAALQLAAGTTMRYVWERTYTYSAFEGHYMPNDSMLISAETTF